MLNLFASLGGGFLAGALQVVWPVSCPVCGKLGEHLCEECLESIMDAASVFCIECGLDAPCGSHPRGPLCRAAAWHSGAARDAVHVMKYRNGRGTAFLMGKLMAARFARPDVDFLVPVPLHKSSDRDYNQAESMARGAGKIWRIPVVSPLGWRWRTPRQALKLGSEARSLPDDALTGRGLGAGVRVFIVDDVYTSGSTVRAAARALEKMGASVAGAMVWSRSGGRVSKDVDRAV